MGGEKELLLRRITLSLPYEVFRDITSSEKSALAWKGTCGACCCDLQAEVFTGDDMLDGVRLHFNNIEVNVPSDELLLSFGILKDEFEFRREDKEVNRTYKQPGFGELTTHESSSAEVVTTENLVATPVEDPILSTRVSQSTCPRNSLAEFSHGVESVSDTATSDHAEAVDKCVQVDLEPCHQQSESKPPGRKRGRPRKCDQVLEKKNKPVPEVILPPSLPEKKYSLRGIKLSPTILGIEKSDNEEDLPMDTDDDSLDPEFKVSSVISREIDARGSDLSEEDERSEHNDAISQEKKQKFYERRRAVRTSSAGSTKRRSKRRKIDMGNAPRYKRRKRNSNRAVACRYCERKFCDYTGVDAHVKKFHQNEETYEEYLETLKTLKPMKCKLCDEVLPDRFQLQYHEDKVHYKANSVSCHKCGKIFQNMLCLRSHIRAVHTILSSTHLCHLCPAKFKWAITLKQHVEEIHEGIRRAVCKVCEKKFYRASQLNRHMRIHRKEESNIICQACGKVFVYEANLQRHMKCVHEPHVEEFHCSFCGKGFTHKAGMISHVEKVHFNMYTFVCSICKMGFARGKQLEEHMATSHQQMDFKVADLRRQRFKYHRTQDDLFYCSCCSDHFYYKAKLVEHMYRSHADCFPHTCDLCEQGFLERGFLITHRSKAHGIAPSKEEMLLTQIPSKTTRVIVPSVHPPTDAAHFQTVDVVADGTYMELQEESGAKSVETLEGDPVERAIELNLPSTSVLMRVMNNEDGTVHLFVEPSGDSEQAVNVEQLVAAYQQSFLPGNVETFQIINMDGQAPVEQTVDAGETVDTVEIVETVDSGILKSQGDALVPNVECGDSAEIDDLTASTMGSHGGQTDEAVGSDRTVSDTIS